MAINGRSRNWKKVFHEQLEEDAVEDTWRRRHRPLMNTALELRVLRGIVHISCPGMQHSARPESLRVCWILLARIVEFLRFLLGVEVVEVAEPLIEAMHRGQKLVTITQMILAELRRGIPDRLEHLRQGGIFLLNAAFRTR